MTELKYVAKNKLYPAFGYADIKNQKAYVREDLPKLVKVFVAEHELYHLKDKPQIPENLWKRRFAGFWAELKANLYAGIRHPLGFLITIILSLQPYRIKLYLDRFKKGY